MRTSKKNLELVVGVEQRPALKGAVVQVSLDKEGNFGFPDAAGIKLPISSPKDR